jgi:hypothetical protein
LRKIYSGATFRRLIPPHQPNHVLVGPAVAVSVEKATTANFALLIVQFGAAPSPTSSLWNGQV